jgi:hypothetical protein
VIYLPPVLFSSSTLPLVLIKIVHSATAFQTGMAHEVPWAIHLKLRNFTGNVVPALVFFYCLGARTNLAQGLQFRIALQAVGNWNGMDTHGVDRIDEQGTVIKQLSCAF